MTSPPPVLVYVESNFLLELVLNQEEAREAQLILERAVSKVIELAIPVYALVEPIETLRRRQSDLRTFSENIKKQLREVERMAHVPLAKGTYTSLAKTVFDALNDWPARLQTQRQALVEAARLLPLDWATIERAQDILQQGVIKREPDALMLAAVLRDAEACSRPSLLLNKNTKDFNMKDVAAVLSPLDCHAIGSFKDGLAHIDARSSSR